MQHIDADTHVDESDETWSALQGKNERHRPLTVSPQGVSAPAEGFVALRNRWWLVEGRVQVRPIRDDVHHPPRVRRELEDVPGRVKHMDEMGVDVQVIFPTFFIRYGNADADTELALTTTYNRWLAEKCAGTNGRLRWACVLPWLQPDKAVAELSWAKENGACGIFKRGFDLDKPIDDRHFFDIYDEANSLGMPLCIHTGHPLPLREGNRAYPIISSFISLLSSDLPQKFPRLRFGLIEAGASWIPYPLAQRAATTRQAMRDRGQVMSLANLVDSQKALFKDNRIFVTIDPVDDVEYLLKLGLEDSLMVGTDYSHHDISANLNAFDEVQSWADEGRIAQTAADKMMTSNARMFYGF